MARKLAAIRCFFQYLLKYGHITANITEKLHNPRQERHCPALLNVDEAFAVLDTGQQNDPPWMAARTAPWPNCCTDPACAFRKR